MPAEREGAYTDRRKVDHAKAQRAHSAQWPDRDVLDLWKAHGGKWHGPNVETVTMPMYLLTGFLAAYAARPATPGGVAAGLRAGLDRLKAHYGIPEKPDAEALVWALDYQAECDRRTAESNGYAARLQERVLAAERERDHLRAENDRLRARLGDAPVDPIPSNTEHDHHG